MSWQGHYYDGRTPARRQASITVTGAGLVLALDTGETVSWPFEEIRQTQGANPGEPLRLERGRPLPEVLVLADRSILPALAAAAPALGRRVAAPPSGSRRLAVVLGALAGTLVAGAALYLWVLPFGATVLARYIPIAWEEEIGRRVAEEGFAGARRCESAAGRAALDAVVRTLLDASPGAGYTYRVTVLDLPDVNAFAAPGGYIVVFAGLLRKTDQPEELAAVLAHEIQHVEQRHTTTALLRELSAGALLTAATGDATQLAQVLAAARLLGQLRHSREAEASADAGGMAMLQAARIHPGGAARFMRKMQRAEDDDAPAPLRYLATHPRTASRVAALERLAEEARYEPVRLLRVEEWEALRGICGGGEGR